MRHVCLALLFLVCGQVFADSPSQEGLFQKGLAAYQNKRFEEARDSFQQLLQQSRDNANVMHNLALTYLQLNEKPMALALWRKALTVNPGFAEARAGRDFLERGMNMRPWEKDSVSLWLRRSLETVSFFELLWLVAFLLAGAGYLWIQYLAERRIAVDEERPMPSFPTAATLLITALAVVLSLVALKGGYVFSWRATVVTAKASAKSLPSDDSVALFELSGGTEVRVRQQQNGWVQIQNSDGSSGWLKDSEIYFTAGN